MPDFYLLIDDKLPGGVLRHHVFRLYDVCFIFGLLNLLAFFYDLLQEMRVVLKDVGEGTLA
ncbi:hypothetical protein TRAPUB_7197 [Trametes pubescens]|uniref:Uncharacterized protein n=1 Tax=Trametes pubescens TaxID=154538 RepID=A0A1M2V3U1_TRAPU|nr:hypothetical protein TRAPUB_7197 [Trametes pubescens]